MDISKSQNDKEHEQNIRPTISCPVSWNNSQSMKLWKKIDLLLDPGYQPMFSNLEVDNSEVMKLIEKHFMSAIVTQKQPVLDLWNVQRCYTNFVRPKVLKPNFLTKSQGFDLPVWKKPLPGARLLQVLIRGWQTSCLQGCTNHLEKILVFTSQLNKKNHRKEIRDLTWGFGWFTAF